MGIRRATHAGSWYSDSSLTLGQQLTTWLEAANKTEPFAKAIIGPHAGYAYSGPNAAWAYKHIDPSLYSRVFLLGPSHHAYIPGAALPSATVYQTPIGHITVDTDTVEQLGDSGFFLQATVKIEEKEHSLEMHLPYIRKVFADHDFKLVPIIIGATEPDQERKLGQVLAPFFEDPRTLFIISSDFCHWGSHFAYKPHDPSKGAIYQYIEWLDRSGMSIIEQHNPDAFRRYLQETENTICGQHPILVLLETINAASNLSLKTSFVKYDQSSQVERKQESSVSYASAVSSHLN
mmetsp:Transcript_18957/g.34334  ORF Transcript_18957/g.34334 Transcript_18957/m.34334 type:complete len:291 (-) Transcript_18957:1322-2194(-)